jgi:hypothetical protein
LESTSAGREEDVAEALCHHAVKALDWAKAEQYGRMAAKKAFARSAFRDATEYFQSAMDAIDKQPISTVREQRAIDLRIEAGSRLFRSEASSNGSALVATVNCVPKKLAMKEGGLPRSRSGRRH